MPSERCVVSAPIIRSKKREPEPDPASEPILAQIPRGAPGLGHWIAVRLLVFVAVFFVLQQTGGRWPSRAWVDELADALAAALPGHLSWLAWPAYFALVWGFGVALALLHFRLKSWLMARYDAPPLKYKHLSGEVLYSDRALSRTSVVVCLLAPVAAVTTVGILGTVFFGWWAHVWVAYDWMVYAEEIILAFNLLREPGCVRVHLRRDGVVWYGRSRGVRRTAARLWLTGWVVGAAVTTVLAVWQVPGLISLAGVIYCRTTGQSRLTVDMGIYRFRWRTDRDQRDGKVERDADTDFRAIPYFPPVLLVGSALFATGYVGYQRRRAEALQHRRLEQETDEARRMQVSLLPAALPDVPGGQFGALFQAAHEVSGDFYLFPEAPDGTVRLVLGDVAGKGLPAALTATLAVGFLRAYTEVAADPAALLEAAGKSLRAARSGRTMVAACAAEWDPGTGRLRWSNAGLPAPVLVRGGAVSWLPGAGVPLGSLPNVSYQLHEDVLTAGDLVLLYTDGVVEATSPLGELFGKERLAAALVRGASGSPSEALERLWDELRWFIGEAEQYDDVTAVAVRLD